MDRLKQIQRLVGREMKNAGMTKPATLIKVAVGVRTPGAASAGTNPVETPYRARGLLSSERFDKIGGTLVEEDDRIIVLFGALIASGQAPTSKDKVTFGGVTSRIVDVQTDAANATYTLLTRK